MRFLLVCAHMPILDTRKKDLLQKFYELYSEASQDVQLIYREFSRRIQVVEELRKRTLEAGIRVSRYWNEVIYWAASVLEREGMKSDDLLKQEISSKLIELYKESGQAYTPIETQFFYGQFLTRYATVASFLETEFTLSLDGYLRRRRRDQPIPAGNAPEETETTGFTRIEKQDPTSLNIVDLCRDIKRSRFLLRPAYQRGEVINRAKSSGIIESILLGIKLPPLYVYRRTDGVSEVIDGQQRILSILGYLGLPFLNESGQQVFSEKNKFQLNKLRILDHLNGKVFDELPVQMQDRIWDFGLSVIAIDERFNLGFSPVDLFIRLNSRPYPIKENTFEMWNSYIDKEIIDQIKQSAARYSGWFYVTRNNARMRNEELITLLTYLYYTQVVQTPTQASMESVIDVFRRTTGINVRVKQKVSVTRMLDTATAVQVAKTNVLEAIKRTESFIRRIRTILTDRDTDNLDEYLDTELTRFFNLAGKKYYVRKLKDFYALWYMTYELPMEVVVRRRSEIRADLDALLRLTRLENSDDESDASQYISRVELFRRKYAIDDRKMRLTDEQRREMIKQQNNKCPICDGELFSTDDIEVDHVVPIAAQGADSMENAQIVHTICNRKKGVAGARNNNGA